MAFFPALPGLASREPPMVLIVGGSTMGGALGMYMAKRLEKQGYRAHRRAKGSSGLARPDFFDWPKEAAKLYETHSPDAAVVMFGGNDGQGLYMGRKADPKWIRWHEEGWSDEYSRRIEAFADAIAPGNEHLFWIGMPPMRSSKLDGRIRRMNGLFRAALATRPNAHFIDTCSFMSGPKGGYTSHAVVDGKRVLVRAGDGVHLSGHGATLIIDRVIPEIRRYVPVS